MKAELSLELIGDNINAQQRVYSKMLDSALGAGAGKAFFGGQRSQPWVAEITGRCERYGMARQFVNGRRDYAKTNISGSRGVRAFYTLESGKLYEVKEYTSWKRSERYFVTVLDSGDIQKLTKYQAEQWLIDNI